MASAKHTIARTRLRLRIAAVQMKFAPTIEGNPAAWFLAANWKQMVRAGGKQAVQASRAFALPEPPAGCSAKARRKGDDR